MNKLFKKIGIAFVGIAMAVGVGVAIGSNSGDVKAAEAAAASSSTTPPTNATWSHVMASGDLPVTATGSKTWSSNNVSVTWSTSSGNTSAYVGYDSTKGVQLGSGTSGKAMTSNYTISTAVSSFGSNKRVTKVAIGLSNANSGGYSGSLANGDTISGTATSVTYYTSAVFSQTTGNITFTFKSTKTKAIYVKAIYVWYENGTTQYSASLANGSNATLSGTTTVDSGSPLSVTIVPDTHYHLPAAGDVSCTMGGNTYAGYNYNASTGAFSIASVTGAVVITCPCAQDAKYTVTYSAGTNGTGTYAITNQWSGDYELPAYADISGNGKVNADSGYRFKDYTVGGQTKAPGDTITLSADTPVTVNFEEQPKEATYEPATTSSATQSGYYPTGATVDFVNTYTNNKEQITGGNSQTWTISGYDGKTIKKMVFSLHNNKTSGAGTINITVGTTDIVEDYSVTGLGDSYVTRTVYTGSADVKTDEDIVIVIAASANSVFCNSIVIEWDESDILDEDLTIDDTSATKTFTVGDTFAFGGTATASYSSTGDKDVTSDVTFQLGSTDIAIGDTITASMLHSETVTSEVIEVGVWYEDAKGNSAAGAYNVTVSYAAVTSVNITTSTSEIAKDGEFTFGATVLPATANQNVTWSASSSDLTEGLDFDIDSATGYLDVDASAGGTIRVTATTVGKDSSSASKTAYVDVTITGDPVVTVSSAISGYSGKNTDLAYSFSNFTGTLSVVSSDTSKVTVGTPTATTAPSGNGTVQVNFVAAGSSTLSFKDGDSVIATCTVTVTASAVDSVGWIDSSNMTVYSGSTALNASKIASWGPYYVMNNGDSDDIESDYTVQLNGSAYTLGTALAAGTYTVTLTYGGKTTASSNPVVTVIQSLASISSSNEYSWTAASGDQTIIAAAGSSGDFVIGGQTWTIERDNVATTNLTSGAIQIGANGNPTNFSITTNFGANAVITSITVQCASYNTDTTASTGLHDISISVGGTSYFSGATPRWASNTTGPVSGTGSSKGDVVIEYSTNSGARAAYLKSIVVEYTNDIANDTSYYNAQAKVVEFAQYINTQMNGAKVCTGDMSNLGTAWGNISSKYTALFGTGTSLDSDELAHAKKMLKSATAKWDEEHDSDEQYCLERAMKTYDWCVEHYSGTCDPFMFEADGTTPLRSVGGGIVNPLMNIAKNSNNIIIIAIVSVITTAAIGGYFFLRKRKED